MLNFFDSVLYETIIAENESEKQVLTIVRLLHINPTEWIILYHEVK